MIWRRFLRRVAVPAVVVLLSLVNGACLMESEWKTAPKFSLVNNTGLDLDVHFLDEHAGPVSERPPRDENFYYSSRHDPPGYEHPFLLDRVDFDDDGCIDVSIVAFERNREDPERDGRLVGRIPAGTCWEPDAKPVFFLGRDSS